MTSLVTGGTGFIGKRLIDKLLARQEKVLVLVREQSLSRFEALAAERWNGQAGWNGSTTSPPCTIST